MIVLIGQILGCLLHHSRDSAASFVDGSSGKHPGRAQGLGDRNPRSAWNAGKCAVSTEKSSLPMKVSGEQGPRSGRASPDRTARLFKTKRPGGRSEEFLVRTQRLTGLEAQEAAIQQRVPGVHDNITTAQSKYCQRRRNTRAVTQQDPVDEREQQVFNAPWRSKIPVQRKQSLPLAC